MQTFAANEAKTHHPPTNRVVIDANEWLGASPGGTRLLRNRRRFLRTAKRQRKPVYGASRATGAAVTSRHPRRQFAAGGFIAVEAEGHGGAFAVDEFGQGFA